MKKIDQFAKYKWWVFAAFILIVALSRLLPHPYNFTPIGGMALFAGSVFAGRKLLMIIPIIAYMISDILVNNLIYANYYDEFIWITSPSVYLSLALIIALGYFMLRKIKAKNVILASVAASVLFYLITNFFVWLGSPTYPTNFAGLMSSYTAAIPFFWNTLVGDLFYCTLLFGSYVLLVKSNPEYKVSRAV